MYKREQKQHRMKMELIGIHKGWLQQHQCTSDAWTAHKVDKQLQWHWESSSSRRLSRQSDQHTNLQLEIYQLVRSLEGEPPETRQIWRYAIVQLLSPFEQQWESGCSVFSLIVAKIVLLPAAFGSSCLLHLAACTSGTENIFSPYFILCACVETKYVECGF